MAKNKKHKKQQPLQPRRIPTFSTWDERLTYFMLNPLTQAEKEAMAEEVAKLRDQNRAAREVMKVMTRESVSEIVENINKRTQESRYFSDEEKAAIRSGNLVSLGAATPAPKGP